MSDLGGVSQFILSLVRHLSRERYEIHFAASGDGPLFEVLNGEHVVTHSLRTDYSIGSLLISILTFRSFLKREKFDIIHAHTTKAGFLCSIACTGIPLKMVYTGHCLRFTQKNNIFLKKIFFYLERYICRTVHFITLLSDSEQHIGISKKLFDYSSSTVVPMSIDIEKFLRVHPDDALRQRAKFGIPTEAFVVGMMGRLTPPRDPGTFLKAAAILNSRIENIYFLWVGDGDLREKTVHNACHLGIEDKVIITGWQSSTEIPSILSAMNVVLHVTSVESISIALLESMASRKPIVASDVGGIPEIIRNSTMGMLFDAGDYKKAAILVEWLYSHPSEIDKITSTAFEFVKKNYTPSTKMAKSFDAVYEKVLS